MSGGDKIYLHGGEVISGGKVVPNRKAIFNATQIEMDGKSYKNAYAFQKDGEYYLYTQGSFLRRHAQGKINVYCGTVRNDKMFLDPYKDHVLVERCYYQFGESGSVLLLRDIFVLRKIVADCPKAAAMLDYNKKELNRRMKKDPNYYLKVIDTYNKC